MTFQEIYSANIELQNISNSIVKSVHRQNYDVALRKLNDFTKKLVKYLDACEEQKQAIGIDTSAYEIHVFLTNIINAQQAVDYILIADLIEMQMLPFLLELQGIMRDSCEVMFCQENWDNNISWLRTKNPALADSAEEEKNRWLQDDNSVYWIEPTGSGLFTMAGNDEKGVYYFHSNTNPQTEACEFAERYYDVTLDEYIIYGFGLGYHCAALASMDEGQNLYIYENSISIIVQSMMANSMDWLWRNNNIHLIYDPDLRQLSERLSSTQSDISSETSFVIHYPSLRHIGNPDIRQKFEQVFIRDSGIRNSRALMESNFKYNVTKYTDVVDALGDDFAGKRAIIVAAGPSLDKNVELLLKKPSDVIVIASGTVFRKLMNMGVEVDYVIVSDANRRVISQMAGQFDNSVPLIYLSTAYKGFAERYQGPRYIVFQKEFERAEKEAEILHASLYKTGGSVVTLALDICIQLKCKNIAFIGLDLAYTDNLAHAEETSRRIANDISDMPEVEGYVLSSDGNNQKNVRIKSSRLFDMYRGWIERRICEEDAVMGIFDATEGGSVINGLKIISLKRYLDI